MIYTASRDYGVKRKSITLSHHSRPLGHIECDSTYRTLLRISKITQVIYIYSCDSTQRSTVISSEVERSPKAKQYPTVIQSVAWNLLERLPLKTKQYEKGTAPRPFYPFIKPILPYIPKLRDGCCSSSRHASPRVLIPPRSRWKGWCNTRTHIYQWW